MWIFNSDMGAVQTTHNPRKASHFTNVGSLDAIAWDTFAIMIDVAA
jgi:hypothetical protein